MILSLTCEQADILSNALHHLGFDQSISDTERILCHCLTERVTFEPSNFPHPQSPPPLILDTEQKKLVIKAFLREYSLFCEDYEMTEEEIYDIVEEINEIENAISSGNSFRLFEERLKQLKTKLGDKQKTLNEIYVKPLGDYMALADKLKDEKL